MNRKDLILPGVLLALLIIQALIFLLSGDRDRQRESFQQPSEAHTQSEESPEMRTVVLFFVREGDPFLHKEEREILASPLVVNQARQTIKELIKGSRGNLISPLPPETKLREIFLSEDGIAYVDFSREIQDHLITGASAEIALIFSVVNSLTYNYKSIKKVFILVDGNEKETLGGHIDLSRPFLPRYDLVFN